VSDHVHVENSVFVELLDCVLGWYTDGADEEASAGIDDDLDEIV